MLLGRNSPRLSMNCPVCSQPNVPDYHPFCSRRCADIDLGRWFNEDYRIPAEDHAEDEEAEADLEHRGALAH